MEAWRTRPLDLRFPYVFLDTLELKQRWDGHVQTMSFMIAVGVSEHGEREPIGVELAAVIERSAWADFLRQLSRRGLGSVQLFVADPHPGLASAIAQVYPRARWQVCTKHFYHGVLRAVPGQERQQLARSLQNIHVQPLRIAADAEARKCSTLLRERALSEAAQRFEADIACTLAFYAFPRAHWQRLRTNTSLETVLRSLRRQTIVDRMWADRKLALLLVCAQLRQRFRRTPHLRWRRASYLDMHAASRERVEASRIDRFLTRAARF